MKKMADILRGKEKLLIRIKYQYIKLIKLIKLMLMIFVELIL
jgi:hypothetical protein